MNRLIFTLLTFLALFSSCGKLLLDDPGDFITRKIETGAFKEIVVYDIFNIVLKSDSIYSLEIKGYSETIGNISAVTDSQVLSLNDHNQYKWIPEYKRSTLRISMPAIDMITLESPSKITTVDTLRLKNFFLVSFGKTAEVNLTLDAGYCAINTGSDDFGYYLLRGKAVKVYFYQQGSSIIDSRNLKSEQCNVVNNSIGDCYINVNSGIEAVLNSKGNIYYTGDPEQVVITEHKGTGRLIRF